MPKVSVIIPAYNAERYIEDCVLSVLNQTERDLECIVVDDGSKDNTLSILKRIEKQDGRLIVLSQENQGQPEARNRGIEIAKAEYIMFIDADDSFLPTMVEKMHKCVHMSGADVVTCGYNNIHTYKKRTYERRVNPSINNYARGDFFLELHQKELFNVVWNKIYKKSLFDKVRFRNFIPGQDAILNLEIAKQGYVYYYLDDCLYNYYSRSGESVINTYKPTLSKSLEAIYENWSDFLCKVDAHRFNAKEFLERMSFERYHLMLKNIYKSKSPYSFLSRNKYINECLLNDDHINTVISSVKFKMNSMQWLFSILYKIHNATLINIVYFSLGKLYFALRRVMP